MRWTESLRKFCGSVKRDISRWNRTYLRNTLERRQIRNRSFSIISNTCIGGVINHDLGLKFRSPTVNIYIRPCDFVKFCADLKAYLELEPVEVKADCVVSALPDYPVAMLGDITLYCKHYADFAEVSAAWERRKALIDWDNLFIIMTDRDFIPPVPVGTGAGFCGEDTIRAFSALPYQNKVCLVKDSEYCKKYACCRQVTAGTDQNCVGIITNIITLSGKRMYQCVKEWDYIDFLNRE